MVFSVTFQLFLVTFLLKLFATNIKLNIICVSLYVSCTQLQTTNTHPKKCSPIISENELKCICLNARSIAIGIVNKKIELDIMVAYTDPHVIMGY